MPTNDVVLSEEQRVELSSIAQSRSLPAGYVFRARLILMLAEGAIFQHAIEATCRLRRRPSAAGRRGSLSRHGWTGYSSPGPIGQRADAGLRARILSATRKKPTDGSTQWSCRKLAAVLGISKDAVHRTWKEAGLKPHRLERYMASDDPDFECKAADIIGLVPQSAPACGGVLRG